jgi:hypothetical protein
MEPSRRKAVEDHIAKIYGGDTSRCVVVELDYSTIRSKRDLVAWAECVFAIPEEVRKEYARLDDDVFTYVWWCMGATVKSNHIVLETHRRSLRKDLREDVRQFTSMLGFHFSRDYGYRIDFIDEKRGR